MPDRQASVLSSDEGEVFTIGAMKIVSRVVGTQSEDAIELYDLIISSRIPSFSLVAHSRDSPPLRRTIPSSSTGRDPWPRRTAPALG